MRAFREILEDKVGICIDACETVHTATDEDNFKWSTKYIVKNSNDIYKVYRLPERYTKGLLENIKICNFLTKMYGYCIEDNCVKMYIHNECSTIDKTFIRLLQCYNYAMFVHMQYLGTGCKTLLELESRCIYDGEYFVTQSSKEEDTNIHMLKSIFNEKIIGYINITEWFTPASKMNVDSRNVYKSVDRDDGETITEQVVRVCSDGTRHCTCIDVYIGTNICYNIRRCHNENIHKIKSEAVHKGLDALMMAGSASEV